MKSNIRELLTMIRTSKKFYATFKLMQNMLLSHSHNPEDLSTWHFDLALRDLTEKSSFLQHHDAITGTHSLTVKRDYDARINDS